MPCFCVGFPASAENVSKLSTVFGDALKSQRLVTARNMPDAVTVDTVDRYIEAGSEEELRQKLREALGALPPKDLTVHYVGETCP